MEVLNKNQRETAIWRLVCFGVAILALNAVILFSSYKAFESRGAGDEDNLRRQLQECIMKAKGDNQRLQNEKNDLESQIKTLKAEAKNKDPEKELLNQRIKLLESQIDGLKTELSICQQKSRSNG